MIDRATVRIIAFGLILIALVVAGGSIWLTAVGRSVPDSLIAIGSGALGSASAFLVSTRGSGEVVVPQEPAPIALEVAAPKGE